MVLDSRLLCVWLFVLETHPSSVLLRCFHPHSLVLTCRVWVTFLSEFCSKCLSRVLMGVSYIELVKVPVLLYVSRRSELG